MKRLCYQIPKCALIFIPLSFFPSYSLALAVAADSMASHPAGVEGNAADEALELLKEMCLYGNAVVQGTIIDWINVMDKDLKLLQHFEQRFLLSSEAIHARKQRNKTVTSFTPLTSAEREEYQNATQTYQMLKEFCEGHNLACQNMLRDQPMHQGTVNVVQIAVDLMVFLADDVAALKMMEDLEVELVYNALECLIEMVQGPCSGNQELMGADARLLNALDTIMVSQFHPRISRIWCLRVKVNAVSLLASCKSLRTHPTPGRYNNTEEGRKERRKEEKNNQRKATLLSHRVCFAAI